MKQVIITKYGSREVLQVQEKRDPTPHKAQVLVRNYFTGINFSEIMARMNPIYFFCCLWASNQSVAFTGLNTV